MLSSFSYLQAVLKSTGSKLLSNNGMAQAVLQKEYYMKRKIKQGWEEGQAAGVEDKLLKDYILPNYICISDTAEGRRCKDKRKRLQDLSKFPI